MMTVHDTFPDRSVCILGLGYVGLTLATVMAEVGFDVLGVEVREDIVTRLLRGEPHFFEPGLASRLHRLVVQRRIRFATHIVDGPSSRVYVITVGTPLDREKRVRLDMVARASRKVREHLRAGDLVIMRSTVKPGTTRRLVIPILEEAGAPFDLAFAPERTLEGRALQELRQLPQIVGGSTIHATVRTAQLFQHITPTVIRARDLETAEIIKLVDNTYRDVTLAYANEVARICDAIGVSAMEVISAGKLGYPRTNVPLPGPVGGPCLEKDPHILAERLRELGVETEIIASARRTNERQPEEIVAQLGIILRSREAFPDQPCIALLGIAFKGQPETNDLRGTMARPVLTALRRAFPLATFRGYDPAVSPSELQAFGLEPAASLEDAFAHAHLACILNNHRSFAAMPIERLAERLATPALIYDFWNHFIADDLDLPAGRGYMALGSHHCATAGWRPSSHATSGATVPVTVEAHERAPMPR